MLLCLLYASWRKQHAIRRYLQVVLIISGFRYGSSIKINTILDDRRNLINQRNTHGMVYLREVLEVFVKIAEQV